MAKKFKFLKISDISAVTDISDKIFLTLDIDWASDEVMTYVLDILEKYNISVSFFATHKTQILDRIRSNKKWELGIHPNFNFLLEGDFRYGSSIDAVLDYYMDIVPEAVSVRSHSMTQSTKILDAFTSRNLKYDCNHFIPYKVDKSIYPWEYWNGDLFKVPYCWEDDIALIYGWPLDVKDVLVNECLKIFDFHPIHIFLNTYDMAEYTKIKDDISMQIPNRHKQRGIQDFFYDLLSLSIKK